jgi:hypothetical protein
VKRALSGVVLAMAIVGLVPAACTGILGPLSVGEGTGGTDGTGGLAGTSSSTAGTGGDVDHEQQHGQLQLQHE